MDLETILRDAERITVTEAARLTGKHNNSIRRQIQTGHLHASRVGREWTIPVLRDAEGNVTLLYKARPDEPEGGK